MSSADDNEHGAADVAHELRRRPRALLARRVQVRGAIVAPPLDAARDEADEHPGDEQCDQHAADVDRLVHRVVETVLSPIRERVRTVGGAGSTGLSRVHGRQARARRRAWSTCEGGDSATRRIGVRGRDDSRPSRSVKT